MSTVTKAVTGESKIKRLALNDKNNLRFLRERIPAHLTTFAEDNGLTFECGNIKFEGDGTSCVIQLKVSTPSADGKVVTQYEKDHARYFRIFDGLQETDLNTATFVSRGAKYVYSGLAMNRRKFPVVGKRCDGNCNGKTMLFTEEMIGRFSR